MLADEGMWAFNNLPLKTLKERYGFEPSKEPGSTILRLVVGAV